MLSRKDKGGILLINTLNSAKLMQIKQSLKPYDGVSLRVKAYLDEAHHRQLRVVTYERYQWRKIAYVNRI